MNLSIPDKNNLFRRKYLEDTSNVYQAINNWTKDANKIYSKYQGLLSNAESLNLALTDELPDNFNFRVPAKFSDDRYVVNLIRSSISYIDDHVVRQSILVSMKSSLSKNHLNVEYIGNISEGQKARVRIVCRMLWYTLTKGRK